jgi:4-alpha-glucanotransferase
MAVQKRSAVANKRSPRKSIKLAAGKPQVRAKTKPRQRTAARYYIVIVNERYYTYSIEGPLAKCEQWHAAAKAANSAGAQIGVYAPSPPLLSSDSARTWAQRNFSYPVFQTRGSILALS